MKVDWTKWSAIAEMISSVAILVTLIFLLAQMNQTSLAIRATADQGVTEAETAVLTQLLNDPNILLLSTQAKLSDTELLQLHSYLALQLRGQENYWSLYRLGAIQPSTLERYQRSLLTMLSIQRNRQWWERFKREFDPDFAEQIDELLERTAPSSGETLVEILRRTFEAER